MLKKHYRKNSAFTLIEMSIVLIIIGLIVGGILLGQDLIRGAQVRAQIAQIEKYNSAVHTFQNKFGGIPGDLNVTMANQFGFVTTGCTGSQGYRDGNGALDAQATYTFNQGFGEVGLFWQDLSSNTAGNLIDATIPAAGTAAVICGTGAPAILSTTAGIPLYFPVSKLSPDNYLYVYENNGINYYGLSALTSVVTGGNYAISNATIPVAQAYNIDKKIDDGIPVTGNVVAVYLNHSGIATVLAPNTATAGGNSTSCYDTTTNTYSTTINSGNNENCALSFKFQ